jgi:hypothetical protein
MAGKEHDSVSSVEELRLKQLPIAGQWLGPEMACVGTEKFGELYAPESSPNSCTC